MPSLSASLTLLLAISCPSAPPPRLLSKHHTPWARTPAARTTRCSTLTACFTSSSKLCRWAETSGSALL
ncbi:hypothetical protein PF010_g30827 [Phytophthora fragariae]|uniref:RxLR effector protein n=1 Tax=Phytophthora fragariae TaxID=53985 RepID=A0A6G0JJS5_9STRA|nr:hypothetical protein PF010_g30827 [Phytophthora fragariae]